MASTGHRGEAMMFWAVLFTRCAAFLFSVVAPRYKSPRQ